MGKNYAESSLKRFLKRKVKITLGVVVSFLITGVVGFAANLPFTEEQLKEQEIISEKSDTEKAEYFLNGYNEIKNINDFKTEGDIFTSNAGKINVKKEKEEIKITLSEFELENYNKDITLKKENLTEKTTKNIEKALTLVEKNGFTEKIQNNVNNGIFIHRELFEESLINNGIFISNGAGQKVQDNESSYNYGVIINTADNNSSQLIDQNSANIYNFGLLYSTSKGQGQKIFGKDIESSTLYNYGTIIAKLGSAQYAEGNFIKINLLNYGIINAFSNGQLLVGQTRNTENTNLINYGIITGKTGQR